MGIDSDIHAVAFFAASSGNHFINEIAEQFAKGFRLLGLVSQVIYDATPTHSANTLNCIVGPHEYHELFLQHLPHAEQQRALEGCHIVNTEQPGSSWFAKVLSLATMCGSVSDISLNGVRGFRSAGISAEYTPLGVAAVPPPDEHVFAGHGRDLDILFMGYASDRREKFFADYHEVFGRLNADLRFVPLDEPRRIKTPNTLFGEDRRRALERTKLLLNIHGAHTSYFEWQRFLFAASSGAVLVSEISSDHLPVTDGIHAVFCNLNDIPSVCVQLLRDNETRTRIAANALSLAHQYFDIRTSCEAILALERRGVLKQYTPLAIARRVISATRTLAGRRFFSRLNSVYGNACVHLDAARSRFNQPKKTEIDKRRLACLKRIQARLASGDPWSSDWVQLQTFGPANHVSVPAISVLVTLYNYEAVIAECLESVFRAHEAAPALSLELIVVDDCSTDRSAVIAKQLLESANIPGVLVRKQTNTGLADARNTAIHYARGQYVFILDADNWILPQGLARLHSAAESTSSDAAYGIIASVGYGGSSRSPLLSQFGWDPRRLVERPYIDAMALFRKASVVALGEYDTNLLQHGWFGWEDYDLWLRHAAHKKRVAMTPQLVACYRVHGRSMINTTNLYADALSRHLEAKYPMLYPSSNNIPGFRFGRLSTRPSGEVTISLDSTR